jgi:hypothetical protein
MQPSHTPSTLDRRSTAFRNVFAVLAAAGLAVAGLGAPALGQQTATGPAPAASPGGSGFGGLPAREQVSERLGGQLKLVREGQGYSLWIRQSVDFGEVVNILRDSEAGTINMLLDKELNSRLGLKVPAITVRNVSATSLVETLAWHISEAWSTPSEPVTVKASGNTQVFRLGLSAGGERPAEAGDANSGVEYFAIADLIDGMQKTGDANPQQSLSVALDLGLAALRAPGPAPQITAHKETGLLIVRASPRQMATIRSAINALQIRTQSTLRRTWEESRREQEIDATRKLLSDLTQELRLLEVEAKRRTDAGGEQPPIEQRMFMQSLVSRIAETKAREDALRTRPAAPPALLDAPPIGGSGVTILPGEPEKLLPGVFGQTAQSHIRQASDKTAELRDRLQEQQDRIAALEKALKAARQQLDIRAAETRKLLDDAAAAAQQKGAGGK